MDARARTPASSRKKTRADPGTLFFSKPIKRVTSNASYLFGSVIVGISRATARGFIRIPFKFFFFFFFARGLLVYVSPSPHSLTLPLPHPLCGVGKEGGAARRVHPKSTAAGGGGRGVGLGIVGVGVAVWRQGMRLGEGRGSDGWGIKQQTPLCTADFVCSYI